MKRKRLSFILATFLIIILSSSSVFAASSNNIGVSTTIPSTTLNSSGGISIQSTEMPSKSNLYTNGEDETVSGKASGSHLYSNYCFKGVTSISYSIHNANSAKLKVVLRKKTSIGQQSVETITISGKSTQYGKFENLSSSTYYFLDFYAPSNFDGTIRGNY